MSKSAAFHNAEQRIADALRSGARELDLSAEVRSAPEKLTELPRSLSELRQLTSLDLSFNGLVNVPEWIGELSNLNTLSLSGNELASLPQSLRQLSRLEVLGLSSNRLQTLPIWLKSLSQLRHLDIEGNELKALPTWFSELRQLEKLDVSNNGLSELPVALSKLTKLADLDISDNELTGLPSWIGDMAQLRSFKLRGVSNAAHDAFSRANVCLFGLEKLNIGNGKLTRVPEWVSKCTNLRELAVHANKLRSVPDWLTNLTALRELSIGGNPLGEVPQALKGLSNLSELHIWHNELTEIPSWISELVELEWINAHQNRIRDIPSSLAKLVNLQKIDLEKNPLNPELAAAYAEGLTAVLHYLEAKSSDAVILNEAKLILIGEGEVGKSCLLDALRDEPWRDHDSTHGIEIKPVSGTHHKNDGAETIITLNAWDFGGQKVYRPTHQLFFSSPAVYLVVWKPREGTQQGAVEYWINTIKHRAGADARVLIVATHGGPQQRQPDISLQDLRDKFGSDTIIGCFHVNSRPDKFDSRKNTWSGERKGIAELKAAIITAAAGLPNVGREVPTSWTNVLTSIRSRRETAPYIEYREFGLICQKAGAAKDLSTAYAAMLNELGYVIHYGSDDDLKKVMILKPDWLAKAISFVLDDEETRARHGLITHERLNQLWSKPPYKNEIGYPKKLHDLFRRLMERFDLSYQVVFDSASKQRVSTSLIAQLVDDQPVPLPDWNEQIESGDEEKKQICQILEREKNQAANAEGLFVRLIARLHKYSLGRKDYSKSVHWQRGLMLEDRYNGRALLRHIGNDIHITVRAAYPDFLLYELTKEVKWLVEDPDEGWAGLRCDVMVPCTDPCGLGRPGRGVFEVGKLKESKRRGRNEYPCDAIGCTEWQSIDCLLQNATVARRRTLTLAEVETVRDTLTEVLHTELRAKDRKDLQRFRALKSEQRRAMSRADEQFTALLQTLTDEAREGPRLFSFEPVDPGFWDKPKWIARKFRLTLWCEHSRLPLTHAELNGNDDLNGVYELELTREWVQATAPYLKVLSGTLSLALPIAASAAKLAMDPDQYKRIENQLEFEKLAARIS